MFRRFAIYFTGQGPLAETGAAWLGWDIATGQPVEQPLIDKVDLADLTETPRRYGFHATIKPPFFLAPGATFEALEVAFQSLCRTMAPARADGLAVSQLGRFLALTPVGEDAEIKALAAEVVRSLDEYRAPPSEAELARRRGNGLSDQHEANLSAWGYPYVMDQFRFHMTLTGRSRDLERVKPEAESFFDPVLPTPFVIDRLALVGERGDGTFRHVLSCSLTG